MIEYLENLQKSELAGLISMISGICLFLYNSRSMFLSIQSDTWKVTTGVILESEIQLNKGGVDNVNSYNPKIKYSYKVNNKEYFSTRIYFGSIIASTFKRQKSENIIDKYPKGKTVNIHYNPMNEKMAVLETGLKSEPVSLLLFGIAFSVFGYFLFTNNEIFGIIN